MRTIAAVALLLVAPLTALAQAKPGGKIVFAARQDIDTLDPHITNRAATRKILIQFTDTLTVINPKDGKVLPGLAESWEVARDGKSYTFKLRRNVKFHDGTPFDAAAVKFTFDRIQEPLGAPGVARAFLGPYDGADVIDAHTVRVRFKQPYAPLLRMVGLSPLAPLSPTAAQKMGQDFSRKPIGTGPFMVKEWIPKSHVTLVRNPDYAWPPSIAAHRGPAHLEEITWRFVPEATTRTAVLQTGEAQIAEDLSYADVAALEKNPDVRILRGVPAGTPWTIFPNVQRFPTNELVPYDPARAKKILDDAGWKPGADGIRAKDGKRLEILWIFGTNNGYEELAPLIQGMAREVGIDIQLREQPRVQMYEAWRKGEHGIGELNWWFPDPSILTTNFHTSRLQAFNPPRLSDPEIDKLLDQAAAMKEEGPRMELYKKIQRLLVESGAGIGLVDQVTLVGTRKEVQGFGFNVVTFPVLYDVGLTR